MIALEHHKGIVTSSLYKKMAVVAAVCRCAQEHPDAYLLIYEKGADIIKFKEALPELNHRAYFFSNSNHLHPDLGYVEDGPFLNINTKATYPTWMKGTSIVFLHASLINQVAYVLPNGSSYLYWLNSIGKLSRPLGILNYQLPVVATSERLSQQELYRFVKQHYKRRWTLILLLCHIWYEKKFPLFAFAKAQFHTSLSLPIDLSELQRAKKEVVVDRRYDVIIPTMGRKAYLKNVLSDLADQTVLPQKVVVYEQDGNPDSQSQLDYLSDPWPFEIKHVFTHVTGACNARNEALKLTSSPWVLFFDDDNKSPRELVERIFLLICRTDAKVINMAYLQKGEVELQQTFKQWESFGSGCAFVHRDVVEKCSFDMALEHGYGEDVDYGMQIRNAGYDVIYAPQIQVMHLKAPIGGFRKPHLFPWQNSEVQPKPSPQIMYHRRKNYTPIQLKGYKTILFFKTFRKLGTSNPISHFKKFTKVWASSIKWSQEL